MSWFCILRQNKQAPCRSVSRSIQQPRIELEKQSVQNWNLFKEWRVWQRSQIEGAVTSLPPTRRCDVNCSVKQEKLTIFCKRRRTSHPCQWMLAVWLSWTRLNVTLCVFKLFFFSGSNKRYQGATFNWLLRTSESRHRRGRSEITQTKYGIMGNGMRHDWGRNLQQPSHLLTTSFTHSFTAASPLSSSICSLLNHSFTHINSLRLSLTHSLTHSYELTHFLFHTLSHSHSLTLSLTHTFGPPASPVCLPCWTGWALVLLVGGEAEENKLFI